jgi:hypothetical protein
MSDNEFNEIKNPHVEETVVMSRAEIEAAGLADTAQAPSSDASETASSFAGKRELLLIVRGMIERVMMYEGSDVKLGRFEPATRQHNELDLTPYGAMDRGVSRFHARIHFEKDQLYITDNKSTNGTYLANVKLAPNVATILRKGDELILGRLPIQVMYR